MPVEALQDLQGHRGPRETAMAILLAWLRDGSFPDRLLERHSGVGHAATQELVFSAVKWRRTLEWRIQRVARRLPRRETAAILLAAGAELFHMTASPPHAVVHASVAMARRRLTRAEVGFVNAVLRGMLRDRVAADRDLASAAPGLRLSHPDGLWQRWADRFGVAAAQRLCEWNNGRAEVVIRWRSTGATMADFMERLRTAGIEAVPHPARPRECLILPRGIRITDIPDYCQGGFSVQDPATLTAVDLLRPQPGESILDACAAPGGKTAALADALQSRGRLVAMDIDRKRLCRLQDNLRRLRYAAVLTVQADLLVLSPDARMTLQTAAADGFDAILLDVPCSNTGVLRRRPDARWRFDAALLADRVHLQQALLTAAAAWVKPGGRVVYSTCSLEADENEALVRRWLADHPSFRNAGEAFVFPPDTGTDGAYAARLEAFV